MYDSYRTSFFAFLTTPLGLALVTVDDGDPSHLVRGIVLVLAALRHFEAACKTAATTLNKPPSNSCNHLVTALQ